MRITLTQNWAGRLAGRTLDLGAGQARLLIDSGKAVAESVVAPVGVLPDNPPIPPEIPAAPSVAVAAEPLPSAPKLPVLSQQGKNFFKKRH